MVAPIPFITLSDSSYIINPQAIEFLQSQSDKPLSIVSVVGKYRTGKSVLINKIFLADKLEVNSTIKACTKGIWMWPELLPDPDEPSHFIIVLDTEGFSNTEENSNHENKIILLSILLSSTLIYNCQGQIDEISIQNLAVVINLAKDIQNKQQNDSFNFPNLLWILRDFQHQLQDTKGVEITSKKYLENCLENMKGLSDTIEQKNNRDCITLVRPIECEKEIQNLSTLPRTSFRKEFNDDIQKCSQKIFSKLKDKKIFDKSLNSNNFLLLAQNYVHYFNTGSVPNMNHTYNLICTCENQIIKEKCMKLVHDTFDNQRFSKQQFKEKKSEFFWKLEMKFKPKIMGNEQETQVFYKQLQEEINIYLDQQKTKQSFRVSQELGLQLESQTELLEHKIQTEAIQSISQLDQQIEFIYQRTNQLMDKETKVYIQFQMESYKKSIQILFTLLQGTKSKERENTKNMMETFQQEMAQHKKDFQQRKSQQIQDSEQNKRKDVELQFLQKENDFLMKQNKKIQSDYEQLKANQFTNSQQFQESNAQIIQKQQEKKFYQQQLQDLTDKHILKIQKNEQIISELQEKNLSLQNDIHTLQLTERVPSISNDYINSQLQKIKIQLEDSHESKMQLSSMTKENLQSIQSQLYQQKVINQNLLNYLKYQPNQQNQMDQQPIMDLMKKLEKKSEKMKELKIFKANIQENVAGLICAQCSTPYSLSMFVFHQQQCKADYEKKQSYLQTIQSNYNSNSSLNRKSNHSFSQTNQNNQLYNSNHMIQNQNQLFNQNSSQSIETSQIFNKDLAQNIEQKLTSQVLKRQSMHTQIDAQYNTLSKIQSKFFEFIQKLGQSSISFLNKEEKQPGLKRTGSINDKIVSQFW